MSELMQRQATTSINRMRSEAWFEVRDGDFYVGISAEQVKAQVDVGVNFCFTRCVMSWLTRPSCSHRHFWWNPKGRILGIQDHFLPSLLKRLQVSWRGWHKIWVDVSSCYSHCTKILMTMAWSTVVCQDNASSLLGGVTVEALCNRSQIVAGIFSPCNRS